MPIVPPIQIPNQVLPNGNLPYVQQQNLGQMVGNVLAEVPNADPEWVKTQINSHVRKIYDRKTWYGLMVRGQIPTTGFIQGGQVLVTQGSPLVTGTNTAWTAVVVGMQFRIGYNTPRYTIVAVDTGAQTLTLEMPWASPTLPNQGYFIAQYFYSFPNVKYIHTAVNLMQAWRLRMDLTQQSLDIMDPWRQSTFTPWALAQMPADANGNYQVELYPVPSIVQGLPYIAVIQPPNLYLDSATLPPYIRTDIVVKFALADAKVYRGPKQNPYYDAAESTRLRGEAEQEILWMARADENLYRQSLIYGWEQLPFGYGWGGANWAINHGVTASERYADDW